MLREVKHCFPVGCKVSITREEFRGLHCKEKCPSEPKIAVIEDMYKRGVRHKDLPLTIPVDIKRIMCITDLDKCKQRILYRCKTEYSDINITVNERDIVSNSDIVEVHTTTVEVCDSLTLTSEDIPDNRFFSASDLKQPIKVNTNRFDIIIREDLSSVVYFPVKCIINNKMYRLDVRDDKQIVAIFSESTREWQDIVAH